VAVTKSGSVNTNTVGDYTITYTAKDVAGNTATKTRTVKVVDATAPIITLAATSPMTVNHASAFTDPGATATDAVDGSVAVTKLGTVNANTVGDYTITYTATDAAGNTATETRFVSVVDATAPVITLTGTSPMTVNHASVYTDPGATATDAVDGAVAVTKSG